MRQLMVTAVEGVRDYPCAVVSNADLHWQEELKRRPKLFDGPVWCLVSSELLNEGEEPRLQLRLQRSSFKFVLYTHFSGDAAQLPMPQRANAIGLMALTETRDGLLVFGKRSSKLACMPGHWHAVPAGQLDSADVEEVLRKELKEETGCRWDVVQNVELLALMDTGAEQGHKTEMVFRLHLRMTAAELNDQYLRAEDRFEHDKLIFVRAPVPPSAASAAAGGHGAAAAAPSDFDTSELDVFLGPGFVLTDVSRRALMLLRELRREGLAN